VQLLSVSLPSTKVGIDWYYLYKEKPSPGPVFRPVTDDSGVRLGEEPPAQVPDSVERYSTFREGGDTSYKGASIDSNDDDEEDSSKEELESISKEDRKISL
jgi:hypothetical protein